MMYAYDKCYLSEVQERIGSMLEYAVCDLHMKIRDFWDMFLKSRISGKIAMGVCRYLTGGSGIELAWEVLEENHMEPEKFEKPVLRSRPTAEYWTGWALGYYQWETGCTFQEIDREVSVLVIRDMYEKYHEMDPEHFCEEVSRIRKSQRLYSYVKLYRMRVGISQREAAEEAGISLRTLQQYEQGQKNIRKASAETVLRLAKVYGVRPEQLLQ